MNTQRIRTEVDTIKEIVEGLTKTEIYKGEDQSSIHDSKKIVVTVVLCITVIVIGLIAYLTWWGVQ
jgi:CHASE3 domain sensor protein